MGDGGEQMERIRSDKDKEPIALSSRETDRPGLEDKEDAAHSYLVICGDS